MTAVRGAGRRAPSPLRGGRGSRVRAAPPLSPSNFPAAGQKEIPARVRRPRAGWDALAGARLRGAAVAGRIGTPRRVCGARSTPHCSGTIRAPKLVPAPRGSARDRRRSRRWRRNAARAESAHPTWPGSHLPCARKMGWPPALWCFCIILRSDHRVFNSMRIFRAHGRWAWHVGRGHVAPNADTVCCEF